MRRVKKFFTGLIILIVVAAVIIGFTMVTINSHVQSKEKDNIV